jgi:hypothetical protein
MKVIMRHAVLILFVWLVMAGACLGKQVYLKDGGVIDSQSAWRSGDKVFVKVNRDIVAEFNLNEIDLRRTFPKSASPARVKHRTVAADAETDTKQSESPAPATAAPAVVQPEPKPAVQPKPEGAAPAPQPAAPPAAVTKAEPEIMQKDLMPQPGAAEKIGAGFSMALLLGGLAFGLLIIASQWIVFKKAGQAGWKCLVPFYNMYILMIISGKPGWWMFLLFIPLVGLAIFLFAMLSLAKKFGRSELFGVGLLLLPMIFFPLLAFGDSEYEG